MFNSGPELMVQLLQTHKYIIMGVLVLVTNEEYDLKVTQFWQKFIIKVFVLKLSSNESKLFLET